MRAVLLAEDSKVLAAAIKKQIESELKISVKCAYNYDETIEYLNDNRNNFFAAIVNYHFTGALDGQAIDLVLSRGVPVIVFTGEFNEELQKRLWEKKVADYVLKDGTLNISYLVSIIQRIYRNDKIKVLVVDDSKIFRSHISKLLAVHKYIVFEAASGTEALDIINKNPDIKLIITDYEMPKMDGLKLIKEIRKKYNKEELSVIGISSYGSENMSAIFIKNGANDFLNKPFQSEEFYCRVSQNVEMIEYIEAVRDVSNRDYLTKLYNRRYFFEAAALIYANAMRKNIEITLTMLDIDFFKKVNDTYGHDAGDIVLKEISSVLNSSFRQSDVVARFGGEEFCIITSNMAKTNVRSHFEDLLKKIEDLEIKANDKIIKITVSMGVCTKLLDSLDSMIKQADKMLYKAKETGRNRICYY